MENFLTLYGKFPNTLHLLDLVAITNFIANVGET